MVSNSSSPPPSGGSSAKFAVVGFLLLLGAGAIYFFTRPSDPPPVQPMKPQVGPQQARRIGDTELDIPETSEDAGVVAPPTTAKKSARRVATSTWDCSGDIPRAPLQQVIAENRSAMRACYERRLKVNNVLQGSLSLTLKVGSDGRVAATQVGGSLRDSEVFSCVRAVANRLRFPQPEHGSCAVVSVPFSFSPQQP